MRVCRRLCASGHGNKAQLAALQRALFAFSPRSAGAKPVPPLHAFLSHYLHIATRPPSTGPLCAPPQQRAAQRRPTSPPVPVAPPRQAGLHVPCRQQRASQRLAVHQTGLPGWPSPPLARRPPRVPPASAARGLTESRVEIQIFTMILQLPHLPQSISMSLSLPHPFPSLPSPLSASLCRSFSVYLSHAQTLSLPPAPLRSASTIGFRRGCLATSPSPLPTQRSRQKG